MKLKLLACAAVLGAGLAAGPSAAHHSFSMFDSSKEMVLTGVVKEWQWTNPHTWIQLLVKNERGGTDEWAIEGGSPNGLSRQGWKRTSLKAGETITVRIRPLKSGEKGGSFLGAVKADGTTLGRQGPAQAGQVQAGQ